MKARLKRQLEKKFEKEIEKATSESRTESKKAGFLETAKNLLKLGLSLDKISEATTLSIEEIQALSAQMA